MRNILQPLMDLTQIVTARAVVPPDPGGEKPFALEALEVGHLHFEHSAGQWYGYDPLALGQKLADLLGQDASLTIVHSDTPLDGSR